MRKVLLSSIVVLVSSTAVPCIAPQCDQNMYDAVYRAAVLRAMHSDLKRVDMEKRNDIIRLIRALCRGQRSTYELPKLQIERDLHETKSKR